jgi:arylsulfatase A-like enzyme
MLTDDQRWDALGVVQRELGPAGRLPWLMGSTPNIDRIAREGFRFRNAFAVSALCSPSRAAMLTGRYNHLNGVANNHTPFPLANVTYASLLSAAGYRTGYFGKWHMGSQRERPGFAEHAGFIGQGSYTNAQFLVNGATVSTVGWVDDVSTDYALDFVRRNIGQPFALVLGFKSPHAPRTPPTRLAGLFADAAPVPPASAASFPPWDTTPVPAASPAEDVRRYSRTLVGVDQNVGRVLALLDELGLARDTVVVFASDNGFFLDEHGMGTPADGTGNKRNAYQEAIRVPLLVRYPAMARRNRTIDALTLNIDLAPTILQLAELPRPATMQGKSFLGIMRGKFQHNRTRFLYEYFYETGWQVPTQVALQQGRYKLIRYRADPAWTELFALDQDPLEMRNLAPLPEAAPILATMGASLDAELARFGYLVPTYADPEPLPPTGP